MAVSLFISNESVQVVSGSKKGKKLVIDNIITEPVPEGAIINGVVMDQNGLKKRLETIFSSDKQLSKKLSLTVDSSSINTKILEVPLLPEAKLQNVVKESYQDVENIDKMLIDYMVLENKTESGGASVLAAMAEKDFISEYSEMLTSLNVKLNKIDISLSCFIKFIDFSKYILGETFIVGVLDKNVLAMVLFVRGKFRFSRRVRIVAEPDSVEMTNELVRNISNMIQFNKSEKTNADISDVYIGGYMPAGDDTYIRLTEILEVNVTAFPDIPAVKMPSGKKQGDFIYSLGNILE